MFNIFGNATTVPPVQWHPQPTFRGTWGVLEGCLTTLALCLWQALHLNVPQHRRDSRQGWYKFWWLVLGLLAPELVAYTAWYQRRAARRLTKRMRTCLGQPQDESFSTECKLFWCALKKVPRQCWIRSKNKMTSAEQSVARSVSQLWPKKHEWRTLWITVWQNRHLMLTDFRAFKAAIRELRGPDEFYKSEYDATSKGDGPPTRHLWSNVHSFYTIMGGFAFETSGARRPFLPAGRTRLAITGRGMVYLANADSSLVPDLSNENIEDRSKANGFAKLLVWVQATWFVVQCIFRLSIGIGISLLELNVFGHAVCALIMYYFWWDKPLDVVEPVLLESDAHLELCALMCMKSVATEDSFWEAVASTKGRFNGSRPELPSGTKFGDGIQFGFWAKTRRLLSLLFPNYPLMLSSLLGANLPVLILLLFGRVNALVSPHKRDRGYSVQMADYALSDHTVADTSISIAFGEPIYGFVCNPSTPDSPNGQRREHSVWLSPSDQQRWVLSSAALRRYPSPSIGENGVTDRVLNWPSAASLSLPDDKHDHDMWYIWFGFTVAPLIYGGLHLLAWNAAFPTEQDSTWWRFSAVTIAATAFIPFAVSLATIPPAIIAGLVVGSYFLLRKILPASWFIFMKDLEDFVVQPLAYLMLTIYTVPLGVPAGLVILGYSVARGYLVVESFMQIARLPESLLAVPLWSQYFPHIG